MTRDPELSTRELWLHFLIAVTSLFAFVFLIAPRRIVRWLACKIGRGVQHISPLFSRIHRWGFRLECWAKFHDPYDPTF